MSLPVLILAAGQSSRMRGTDKLLEQIDGQAIATVYEPEGCKVLVEQQLKI